MIIGRSIPLVEQRNTYLRPRHGLISGPQIFIGEDLKDYARVHGTALDRLFDSAARSLHPAPIVKSPTQFAGPDSDERIGRDQGGGQRGRVHPSQAIIALDAAE